MPLLNDAFPVSPQVQPASFFIPSKMFFLTATFMRDRQVRPTISLAASVDNTGGLQTT
jgi:hypothetical protein